MRFIQTRRITTAVLLGLLCSAASFAQSSACDLDSSGSTNVVDVTRAVNMALGTTACTANVEGPSTCTVITVQRVVNAALGQPCVTYNAGTRSVLLTWLSSPSAGVAGYNVYRRVGSTGTFTKINTSTVTSLAFTDRSVSLGTTYQYAVTAIDALGNESSLSTAATAVIPAS